MITDLRLSTQADIVHAQAPHEPLWTRCGIRVKSSKSVITVTQNELNVTCSLCRTSLSKEITENLTKEQKEIACQT
jgi:hypothetical protein